MGMPLQDVTLDFTIAEDNQAAGVKKLVFKKEGCWNYFQSIGFYPLTFVSAEFFDDKLYRINLAFAQNQIEIFDIFKQRFGKLQNNDTWTRGSMKLKAKSAGSDKLVVTILAPDVSYGSGDGWDAVILLDVGLWKGAEQFKKGAPKRAAKDF